MKIDMAFIIAQLKRRAEGRQLLVVANATGVGKRTMQSVMSGEPTRVSTAIALQDYLKDNVRRDRLEDTRAG